jgi:hypothetical protein
MPLPKPTDLIPLPKEGSTSFLGAYLRTGALAVLAAGGLVLGIWTVEFIRDKYDEYFRKPRQLGT